VTLFRVPASLSNCFTTRSVTKQFPPKLQVIKTVDKNGIEQIVDCNLAKFFAPGILPQCHCSDFHAMCFLSPSLYEARWVAIVGIATGCELEGSWIESRLRLDIPHLFRPGPLHNGYRVFGGVKSGRGVTLNPHTF